MVLRYNMSVLRSILTFAFVVVACSSEPTKTPQGGKISCRSDDDCAITDSIGCCVCCKSDPRALPRAELERQQHTCEGKECEACSAQIQCPKVASVGDFVAKCASGTCSAVHR